MTSQIAKVWPHVQWQDSIHLVLPWSKRPRNWNTTSREPKTVSSKAISITRNASRLSWTSNHLRNVLNGIDSTTCTSRTSQCSSLSFFRDLQVCHKICGNLSKFSSSLHRVLVKFSSAFQVCYPKILSSSEWSLPISSSSCQDSECYPKILSSSAWSPSFFSKFCTIYVARSKSTSSLFR